MPCRRLKTSALVVLSLFFLAQPLEWAYAAVQWMHPGWVPPSLSVAESYASLKSAVDTGNFWLMAWENLTTGQWASLAWGIEAGRLMQAPGLFLLGFVLGRQDFFLQNDGMAAFWTRGLLFSLVGAGIFYVVMCLPGLPGPVHTVFNMWHNACFTGVWVAGFVLLYRLEYFRKATAPLLTYGRMSLTNYVSQSVIGSLIFSRMRWGWLPTAGIWPVLRSALPPWPGRYGSAAGGWSGTATGCWKDYGTGRHGWPPGRFPVRNAGRKRGFGAMVFPEFERMLFCVFCQSR